MVDGLVVVDGAARLERPSERLVLWVDDRPDNNRWERTALESYGIRFELAESTSDALAAAARVSFAAIISDLGRGYERRAGLDLLSSLRASGSTAPYFIYTSSRAARWLGEIDAVQGVTADPDELVAMVVAAVR